MLGARVGRCRLGPGPEGCAAFIGAVLPCCGPALALWLLLGIHVFSGARRVYYPSWKDTVRVVGEDAALAANRQAAVRGGVKMPPGCVSSAPQFVILYPVLPYCVQFFCLTVSYPLKRVGRCAVRTEFVVSRPVSVELFLVMRRVTVRLELEGCSFHLLPPLFGGQNACSPLCLFLSEFDSSWSDCTAWGCRRSRALR